MGMALTALTTSSDVAELAVRRAEPLAQEELDVDDVRMLLRELRLRRQLREDG